LHFDKSSENVFLYEYGRRSHRSLGAMHGRVVWMVLRDCLLMVALGIPLGLWLSRLATSQLFGVLREIR
jgi:hypothetical protein